MSTNKIFQNNENISIERCYRSEKLTNDKRANWIVQRFAIANLKTIVFYWTNDFYRAFEKTIPRQDILQETDLSRDLEHTECRNLNLYEFVITFNLIQSQIKSNQIKLNKIKLNQIKSNQIKSNIYICLLLDIKLIKFHKSVVSAICRTWVYNSNYFLKNI